MKSLLTKLRYVPTRFGLVAAVLLATAGAAVTFAWGPSRETFTVENPAPYVTFNSITNNPIDGDERNFSRAKDTAATTPSAWNDSVAVSPGKEYVVRMVVHNNAADNLKLNATNTRASASVPTTTGKSVTISNFVSADNAKPGKVWDDVTFTGTQDFNLAYVPGSARIYNSGYAAGGSGQPLPDSIVTSAGAVLGYNKAGDGIIPGCFKYLSYVEYKVKPQFAPTANFEVAKTVRKSGTTTWGETAAVAAGGTVQYRIKYSNTSTVQQDNVVVKDTLPAGVSYVAGTTKLYNNLFPNGKAMSENITGAGINIGHHSGGSASFVVFDAKVATNDNLAVCGPNTLKNIAKVVTDYGTKEDGADVTVSKTCAPTSKAECKEIKANKISRTSFSFDGAATVSGGATVSKYTFVVKNAAGATVVTKEFTTNALIANSGTVALPTAGTYSVTLSVTTSTGVKTGANCTTTVTVTPEDKDIRVCQLSTKTFITIKESAFDATKHSMNPDDCKTVVKYVEVCRLSDKKTVRITESEYNANKAKYSTNPEDCKVLSENYIKVCRLSDKAEITINEKDFDATKHSKFPTNDCKTETPVTPVTPETPETIASTGAGAIVGGLFGSSALGLGISSFVRSRAALRSALNR